MTRWPNCFIAGAPRSGTTFLARAVGAHPDAFLCDMKEPHFFGSPSDGYDYSGPGDRYLNATWISSESDYLALYRGRSERVLVDGSTTLMFWPDAVAHIELVEPSARFVVVLRDPVDRAASAYRRHRAQGLEPAATLRDAIEHELAGHRAGWSPGFRYHHQSCYSGPLDALREQLGDRLLVLTFLEVLDDPDATVRRVWRHVDLRADHPVVLPDDTNATPAIDNPLLRLLLVRPLRARRFIAAIAAESVVERTVRWRANRVGDRAAQDLRREEITDYFSDDLTALERGHGVILAAR